MVQVLQYILLASLQVPPKGILNLVHSHLCSLTLYFLAIFVVVLCQDQFQLLLLLLFVLQVTIVDFIFADSKFDLFQDFEDDGLDHAFELVGKVVLGQLEADSAEVDEADGLVEGDVGGEEVLLPVV